MARERKLTKLAFVSPNTGADSSTIQSLTFKDNLISGAATYLTSQYSWLDAPVTVSFTEVDSKKGVGNGVGVINFPEGFVVEIPIRYSDGSFSQPSGFYIPSEKSWFPFNEDFWNIIKNKLAPSESSGTNENMTDTAAGTNNAFASNNGNSLSASNPTRINGINPYKYSATSEEAVQAALEEVPEGDKLIKSDSELADNMRSSSVEDDPELKSNLIPVFAELRPSVLQRYIKTASANYPFLVRTLTSAYNVSRVNRARSIEKIASKNRKEPKVLVYPNPVMEKISTAFDIDPSIFERFGTSRLEVVNSINKYAYASMNRSNYSVKLIDEMDNVSLPSEAELVSLYEFEDKLEKIRTGRGIGFKLYDKELSTTNYIVVKPRDIFRGSNPGNRYDSVGDGYSDNQRGVSHNGPKNSPVTSYTQAAEYGANTMKSYDSDNFIMLYKSMSNYDMRKVFEKIYTETFSIKHLKAMILSDEDVCNGKTFDVSSCFTIYDGTTIYRLSSFKAISGNCERYDLRINDMGNGYVKAEVYIKNLTNDDRVCGSFIPDGETVFTGLKFVYQKDTGAIVKIVDAERNVINLKDKPMRSMSAESIKDMTLTPVSSDVLSSYTLKGVGMDATNFIIANPSCAFNRCPSVNGDNYIYEMSDLKAVFNITPASYTIDKAFNETPYLVLDIDETVEDSPIDVYLSPSRYIEKKHLKVHSADLRWLLPSIGFNNEQTQNLIKKAEEGLGQVASIIPDEDADIEELHRQIEALFEKAMEDKRDMDRGFSNPETLTAQQLNAQGAKTFDDLVAALNDVTVKLDKVVESLNKKEEVPVEAPIEELPATIDAASAQSIAANGGLTPEVAAEAGMNPQDLAMVNQASQIMGAGGQPMPQQVPVMGQESAPMIQEQADQLVQGLLDPNVAAQLGITPEELAYVQNILVDPNVALANGENPEMVNALLNSYDIMTQTQAMAMSSQIPQTVPQAPMQTTDAMAPVVENFQDAGMYGPAGIVSSASALKDLLPKVKASNIFSKYSEQFKSMLTTLGELLFAMDVQSTRYKEKLGEETYDNTIEALRKLYADFGEFVIKMYMM